jgi:hypothetical protein
MGTSQQDFWTAHSRYPTFKVGKRQLTRQMTPPGGMEMDWTKARFFPIFSIDKKMGKMAPAI